MLRQPAKTRTRAAKKLTRPPSAFEVSFACRATAPLMPALAMFAKYDSASLTVPRLEANAASVDRLALPVESDVDGRVELARNAVAAREIHAGAEGDHRELRAVGLRKGEQAVCDLVHRSVTADGDDLPRAVGCGLRDELGEVTRPLREERDAVETQLGRPVGELRPAPPGGTVVRGRVDEEDGLSAQR